MEDRSAIWRDAVRETAAGYRRMIDAAVEQLTDEELTRRPAPGVNSVAVILRHLGGNLRSRWTDFFTTDGEKPDRDRESEFADWPGDRASLLGHFDAGWSRLLAAIEEVTDANLDRPVVIRGETHTLPQAIERSLTHVAYHAGQIAIVARMVHAGEWRWLTVAPGGEPAPQPIDLGHGGEPVGLRGLGSRLILGGLKPVLEGARESGAWRRRG